jgi:hypothetical protein
MPQVVEWLSSKHKALSTKPKCQEKKNKTERERLSQLEVDEGS